MERRVVWCRNMIGQPPHPPRNGASVLLWATNLYRWLMGVSQEVQFLSSQQRSRRLAIYASDLQFGCHAASQSGGSPQVRVYKGWHMLPHGAFAWPASGEYEDVLITGTGWLITRQPKSGPGAVDVVFQATQANPASSTHYESDVCKVDYDAGAIEMRYMNTGERNFVATI